jgi:broad specificity phosphatase PhoE
MPYLHYATHPQVEIDPNKPVTLWSLSARGRERASAALSQDWTQRLGRVVSSDETKAVEFAELLARARGLVPEVRTSIGENDRRATGFVPPSEFELLANAFFARPEESVRGWERAVDAQRRIARGLADLLSSEDERDIAVVGHGAVGTLWYCHLNGLPISREQDQPGQGHYFTVDRASGKPLHAWRPIDATGERA